MADTIRSQKEQKLKEIIQMMSTNNLNIQSVENVLDELKNIYSDGYRHDYSVFFPWLSGMQENEATCSVDILLENLQMLRKYIDDNFMNTDGTYNSNYKMIVKLTDHLNLEISRLRFNTKTNAQLEDLQTRLSSLQNDYNNAKDQLETATKKAESMQAEFISILSIFSAVVLLFFVNTEYIGQAIANLQNGSILRLGIVLAMCGLVLFNGLYLMFYFIAHIINKNSDVQSDFGKNTRKILIVFDVVLLLVIALCVYYWFKNKNG